MAQSFSFFFKLFWAASTNYPDVKEGPLDAWKNASLQRKTLHQASINACTSLSRIIVFPRSVGRQGFEIILFTNLITIKQGVWKGHVELHSLVEGCLDCQQWLLLNCQNSHQAAVEVSTNGRSMHISPQTLTRPSVTKPSKSLISF